MRLGKKVQDGKKAIKRVAGQTETSRMKRGRGCLFKTVSRKHGKEGSKTQRGEGAPFQERDRCQKIGQSLLSQFLAGQKLTSGADQKCVGSKKQTSNLANLQSHGKKKEINFVSDGIFSQWARRVKKKSTPRGTG